MKPVPSLLQEAVANADGSLFLLDHAGVEWNRVQRTSYLVHQHYQYDYPGPIRSLDHRLVITPPEVYGDQRRVVHLVDVKGADASMVEEVDEYGNTVLRFRAARVQKSISFEAWFVLERSAREGPPQVSASWLTDARLLEPSRLTMPDQRIRETAAFLASSGETGVALARRVNAWVHRHMKYGHDLTHVGTTAAEAFALGQGVCQDYAHLMLSICRVLGLPCRYVSGHLLGEGGTHAWVEVLVPSTHAPGAVAWPFDATHDCEWGLNYLTVAVGRDYGDVAPTSGSFIAPYSGQMSTYKRIGLTAIDYEDVSAAI
jgi:transglutaminase-like putative cysteine protease